MLRSGMETWLLIAGLVLLVVSCCGVLKFLLRLAALACIAAGIWYGYHGGREEMTEAIESGRDAVAERLDGLAEEERELINQALHDPASVAEAQKARLVGIAEKLISDPKVGADAEARMWLDQLTEKLRE